MENGYGERNVRMPHIMVDPGSGGPWEWRILEVANPGSGGAPPTPRLKFFTLIFKKAQKK